MKWIDAVVIALVVGGFTWLVAGCTPFDLISAVNGAYPNDHFPSYAEWKAKNCRSTPC